MVRRTTLPRVSAKMASDLFRRNLGLPSALAVRKAERCIGTALCPAADRPHARATQAATLTAVGTTHGHVAVFDADQELRCVLGTAQSGASWPPLDAPLPPPLPWWFTHSTLGP
jgi:hypothetical protein